jgi:hypothetical protein
MKIKDWLCGKKTYIVTIFILVAGILSGFGVCEIPEFVWAILGAFGLGSVRLAVVGIEKAITAGKEE